MTIIRLEFYENHPFIAFVKKAFQHFFDKALTSLPTQFERSKFFSEVPTSMTTYGAYIDIVGKIFH